MSTHTREMPSLPTVTADDLLTQLQSSLSHAGARGPFNDSLPDDHAVKSAEKSFGARAVRAGRCLDEMLAGSPAWELFEPPMPRRSALPRLHELSQSQPILKIMRESGELAEREQAYCARDRALQSIWNDSSLSDENRRVEAEAQYKQFRDTLAAISSTYRLKYEHIKRAAHGDAVPLAGPRIRSRTILQPPIVTLMYSACHRTDSERFAQTSEGTADRNRREFRAGGNAIALAGNAATDFDQTLDLVDPMLWDILAVAMIAFFVRTTSTSVDTSFPFQIDDYFLWRGVDPRKRTRTLHRAVNDRLKLLFSDDLIARAESALWLADPQSNRRVKTISQSSGPFLISHAPLIKQKTPNPATPDFPEGYIMSLGEWARPYVASRSMRGAFLRPLAEYDLQRQQWERRIGWYLVFQMFNQRRRMQFDDLELEGKRQTVITPQHPLRMGTVLAGSHVAWREIAATNPGKVIRQWTDALAALQSDGVIGPVECLDGDPAGSDVPSRGRLTDMLERRYRFIPGTLLLPQFRSRP